MFSLVLPLALAASVLVSPIATTSPVPFDVPEPPTLTADRWIVYDADEDVVLASWNANDQAPMASVTKVLTAMVVLDNVDLSACVGPARVVGYCSHRYRCSTSRRLRGRARLRGTNPWCRRPLGIG